MRKKGADYLRNHRKNRKLLTSSDQRLSRNSAASDR
jgi:hypothetical protein